MSLYKEKQACLALLETSGLFEEKGKTVIRSAIEDEVLPDIDFEYIFDVMKMEQNMNALIDQRADARLLELEKQYTQKSS